MSMTFEEYLSSNNGGATDDDVDLARVIAKFNETAGPEPEEEPDDPKPAPNEKTEPDPEPEKPKDDPEPPKKEDEGEPSPDDKSAQNAANAERRRQREQAIAQKALENSQEYQLVKQISELSGKSVEQLLQEIKSAKIAQALKSQGYTQEQIDAAVPVVQEAQRKAEEESQKAQQTSQENVNLQFQLWQQRIATERAQVLKDHPYLTDTDMDAAQYYMLQTLGNPHIPFIQAVQALHSTKILEGTRAAMKTELLAEISGRTGNNPLPPQTGGKPNNEDILTDDEKFVAKAMGISEKDYIANKTKSK